MRPASTSEAYQVASAGSNTRGLDHLLSPNKQAPREIAEYLIMGHISPFMYSFFPPQPSLSDGAAVARNFLRNVLPTTVPTPPQQGFGPAPIPPLGKTDSFTANYAPEIYQVALQSEQLSTILMGLNFSHH